MNDLLDYQRSISSQEGEDGVIEEIFRRLGIENGWCVEFGAWDGKLLSNTWNLWHKQGWNAVLIEGDPAKAQQLANETAAFPGVIALNRMVSHTGEGALDHILAETEIPLDFDLLSVDVDGNDYHIWAALETYQPKLVVIEFNATMPVNLRIIDRPGGGLNLGSSALALVELGHKKGYALITSTSGNLFFLRRDLLNEQLAEVDLVDVFPFEKNTNVISTFTGLALLTRKRPSHIRIDTNAGVRNQINLRTPDPPAPLHKVVLLAKDGDHEYEAILKLVAKHAWLRRLLVGLASLAASVQRKR